MTLTLLIDECSFVGAKAEEHRGALMLNYPMENGIVQVCVFPIPPPVPRRCYHFIIYFIELE